MMFFFLRCLFAFASQSEPLSHATEKKNETKTIENGNHIFVLGERELSKRVQMLANREPQPRLRSRHVPMKERGKRISVLEITEILKYRVYEMSTRSAVAC